MLVAAASSLLSYGVVGSETFGWLTTRTVATLALGVAVAGLFVAHQRRTAARC